MNEDLIKSREFYELFDLSDEQWGKLQGEPNPGCGIRIQWKKYPGNEKFDPVIDEGYIFILPGMDASICDCYFHIPNPDNSGGKGDAPEKFGYLIELMTNEFVEKITFKQQDNG
jgi:hypothetical protein